MPQYQGVWSLQQQMQALTSGQWATDPLFDYTTLLLQADNAANSAQNNTFLDSSTANGGLGFPITRNGGNPGMSQGSFSPFSLQPGAWANFFNGSTDYLLGGNSADYTLGTGNFSVEFFIFPVSSGSLAGVFGTGSASNGTLQMQYRSDRKIRFNVYAGSTIETSTPCELSQWTHIVFTRSSNSIRVFQNGVLRGYSASFPDNILGADLSIGRAYYNLNQEYFPGYISNLRIIKGSVPTEYQTSATADGTFVFNTPTAPLTTTSQGTTASNVSILTCQSNRYLDNSTTSVKTITPNGTPSVQAFSPFAPQFQYTASGTGGSGYFDGSGDYLTTNNINLAANAFTIEGWFYVTTTAGNMNYWGMTNGGGSTPKAVLYMDNVGNLVFETGAVSGAVISVSISTYVKRNAWQHIAISRSGTGASQTAMFIDGVRVGTGTCASLSGITAGFNIGYVGEGFGVTFNGYIAGFRIVNGTAVYNPASTTVTIPTAPLTAVTNTALLTNFTNAGILDGTMKNNLETVGNASVSTSVVKYGSGSMAFDGTGDYLFMSPPTTDLFAFGSGEFTIEMWIYRNVLGVQHDIIAFNPTSTNGAYIALYIGTDNLLYLYANNANRITGGTINTGTWYHIALARSGTSTKLFINGTQSGSTYTDTTVYLCGANRPIIGSAGFVVSGSYNGYIDDLRITKGIARYTQNFIPPSVALPRQ